MKFLFSFLAFAIPNLIFSQMSTLTGSLLDEEGAAIEYANVVLHSAVDSSITKIETSNEEGVFRFISIEPGDYFLESTYVGYQDIKINDITLQPDEIQDLGELEFLVSTTTLQEATVTARRAMVEVKPDRTVFNVQGTINSIGSDGISLLRKAPGVVIDNNNNITVLGRNGVLVYVDGKRLPLAGEELSNYLQNLTAEQIDRIDIISNPGAKYEAEGNAGVIDIRLKKDKNHGTNGTISSSFTQGHYGRGNLNFSANHRNKKFNLYGSTGAYGGTRFTEINFDSYQNGINLKETALFVNEYKGLNARVGIDFSLGNNQTLGFLVSGNLSDRTGSNSDIIKIADEATPEMTDSVLIALTDANNDFLQSSYNINYRYESKDKGSVNIDVDYGIFDTERTRFQPNEFYTGDESTLISRSVVDFNTPTDISIFTTKLDVERNAFGGSIEFGGKLSMIDSDNSFLVFDVIDGTNVQDDFRSNIFNYNEDVYAGYFNFKRKLSDSWNMSAGLRTEHTKTNGDLIAFLTELQEDPVKQEYTSYFPSAGLTYSKNPNHIFSLNYGRRINRPNYEVLNPFNTQLSEISFSKGNPGLLPEIVNNYEFSYTWKYRYNLKLSYSKTTDQITRLIGPDDVDPRATFINWDNLAEQMIYNASLSIPVQVSDNWNAYFNASVSHKNNQSDYGDGAIVDVQAFSYSFYQQQTFTLPKDFTFEVSGWFSGPGIWGGVFEYDESYSLNFGIQKRFLNNNLNVKLAANDVFDQAFWSGFSEFDGLYSEGYGQWDSRNVSLNISYSFGNQNVKSRKRKTGIEDEASRVEGNN